MAKYTIEIEVTASNAHPSTTIADKGAWDVEIDLEIGGPTGRKVKGEVTLAPRGFDGKLASWGDMDHWMSGELCAIARDLTDEGCAELCREIEACASEAVEEAGHAE